MVMLIRTKLWAVLSTESYRFPCSRVSFRLPSNPLGPYTGAASVDNNTKVPQTLRMELPGDPAILPPGVCSEPLEHLFVKISARLVHCGIVHNSRGVDAA